MGLNNHRVDNPDSGLRDDLVVATPERVAFQYPVAGLGTRALAQLIDLLLLTLLLALLGLAAYVLYLVTQIAQLSWLVWILGSFGLVWGYFLVLEAAWSGQTLGKRVFGLRAVGDQGEPLRFAQAAIRNLVRFVDFLPLYYGIGVVVLFVNGRGKRLGDLAAGTLVVRERGAVKLKDLPAAPPPPPAMPILPAAVAAYLPPAPEDETLRRLPPELRRFVAAYARRRHQLSPALRVELSAKVQKALTAALPEVVAAQGPLVALDQLADLELPRGEPISAPRPL